MNLKEKNRNYYLAHKDEIKARSKAWAKSNPGKKRASWKKSYHTNASIRQHAKDRTKKKVFEIIKKLGSQCARCSFRGVWALQIHHRNGQKDGKRDFIKKGFDFSKVELLCANCHCFEHYKNIKICE